MKNSFVLFVFFAGGIVCGLLKQVPSTVPLVDWSFYALLALLFSIGLNLGKDETFFSNLKNIKKRLYALPILTITGTLTGCLFLHFLFPFQPVNHTMAVGAGLGYYSLSSILITKYIGVHLGVVALLANIFRESFALFCAPFIARYFGKLSLISAAGVTSMDVTLPVITRYAGNQYVALSVAHGVLVDSSVPFIVTFLCLL